MEYKLSLVLKSGNRERTTELPFDDATITRLILEAETRGIKLPELIAALVTLAIRNDMLDRNR